MFSVDASFLKITANGCGYELKALVAQSADVSCGTLAEKLSRRQDTMAQFLQSRRTIKLS
jgi:hypothetical protein